MTDVAPHWGRVALAVVRSVAPRPWLWPAALGALFHLARTGWWRRWPPTPVPGPGYWRFRTLTAYGGDGEQVPPGEDVVAYLRWCRRTRRLRG